MWPSKREKKQGKKPSTMERATCMPWQMPGGSRGSPTSKPSHSRMETLGQTKGQTLYGGFAEKRACPLSTKIFQEFDDKTKDCWPMGKFYTIDITIFNCHGVSNTMKARVEEKGEVTWEMNNIMNNPSGERQTTCVTPKDPFLRVTQKTWEQITT